MPRRPHVNVNGMTTSFSSYTEIKKNMKLLIERSLNSTVSVYRSRRGEWGEWFEHWALRTTEANGKYITKPTIIKQGWL